MSTRDIGKHGEDIAMESLISSGMRLICRNYTVRGGEIDLIMEDGIYIVFVEVKSRSYDSSGAESVDAKKQKRMIRTAERYAYDNHCTDRFMRFDVVLVDLVTGSVTHIRDAFRCN